MRLAWAIRHGKTMKMTNQADLFGGVADPAQGSLFGEGRLETPQASYLPNPEDVRRRLQGLLAKARSADTMPWKERDARMWQIVFPNMANWLPDEEADQLRFAFAEEMQRLRQAA